MLSKKALKKISKKARKAIRQAKGSACGEKNTRTEGDFHISNGENEIPGNADILGVIGKRGRRTDRLCSFQGNGSGRNLIILDTPSGAINTWMIPAIYQNIKRGQSVIVTDPEGQLYAETAHIAENHGYDVKIFDPRPINLTHSDGCDILKPLKDQCRDFLGQDYPDFEGVFDDRKVA
ncbi:MAG: type IV secretory system conjugative DNA transfer family protein, partial [Lachnospiraceae bacterium]|nr:type IV secretory system conjugative DNA transfer family protein [Lachnospiraceae bacterium]